MPLNHVSRTRGVEGYENIHYHVNISNTLVRKWRFLVENSAVDWALAFENCQLYRCSAEIISALEHSVQALQESSVTIKTIRLTNSLEMEKQR